MMYLRNLGSKNKGTKNYLFKEARHLMQANVSLIFIQINIYFIFIEHVK